MITPLLEKLILNGDAEYFTYATGGSGVATIPFPKNCLYMVLVDFIWNPFSDSPNLINDSNMERLASRMIHTMSLQTESKKSYYNFRDTMWKFPAQNLEIFAQLPMFQSPVQYHTFISSKQDIYVDIFCFSQPSTVNWNTDAIPLDSNEPQTPNGYGLIPAIRSLSTPAILGSEAEIISLGVARDAAGIILDNASTRNEFFDNIDLNTALIPPTTDVEAAFDQVCFPLVTFGLVAVNKVPTAKDR